MLDRLLKVGFVLLILRPLVFIWLGLNTVNRQSLPTRGPAIIAANHNSHLDVMVLLALFPLRDLHRGRPVAAADYFLSNRYIAWFSTHVLNIIPLDRNVDRHNSAELLTQCHKALDEDEILIIFPEGSRGRPEVMGRIKKGVYRLVQERSNCPVYPVVMRGLGRALPRGTARLVPFNVDVVIGEGLSGFEDPEAYLQRMRAAYAALTKLCITSSCVDRERNG
ncbi:lysophospholipid acyltransferase family protein [Marinobacterium lutimaris]|uniref:1-acyl-sn-glycerol-3-phosphate acyltransferase n=1 Tax=Marinobacterium lutimaris TaxID=568106 RepID=A0A1H6D9S9_9GAMM|nr:lysophospholipid acyltransferase family protein [Marinobacterium lutimaris]SEG81834.1 1-acyl-sn-glycerol-3-phosphate acyltransferase [Marinobacterium lutimaris]